MVSAGPLISKSSSLFTNYLGIVPSTPITIGNTATFMFHSFLQFSGKYKLHISLFSFFSFHFVVLWHGRIHRSAGSLFFFFFVDYH